MRILQLIPSLAVGGLERVATTLTVELAARGEDVVVCSAGAQENRAFEHALLAARVPLVHIPRPRAEPRAQIRSWRPLVHVLRDLEPDVIHAHNPGAAMAAAAARLLARRPHIAIVTTYHGMIARSPETAVRLLRRSDVVAAIGPAVARELVAAGLPIDRLTVVANGVRLDATRSRAQVRRDLGVAVDDELVVTVGRYTAEKNQAVLVDAVALLVPQRPRLRAAIVGVGELDSMLRARVQTLGLDEHVRITGPRDDARDVAAAADVATLTSNREGLGLTLIEAMAAGTPVVGTRVGGIPDVIEDGVTGLLVPPNDPSATAAAVERLLSDAELRARVAAAGRTRARERFSLRAMVDGYLAAYASAVARRTRSSARRAGASPSK